MEKSALKDLEKRIDEVLFYMWDPIGVKDEPYARAEYGTYVSGVLGLVVYDKSAEEIADYLCRIESEYMGLTSNKKHALEVAERVIQYKEAIKEGCS